MHKETGSGIIIYYFEFKGSLSSKINNIWYVYIPKVEKLFNTGIGMVSGLKAL